MNYVFVLDTNRQPLDPVHPAKARRLLSGGQAAVLRRQPFTIILKQAAASPAQALRVKIGPGSQTTGLALVNDATGQVLWAAELAHRGNHIRDALLRRQALRHNRRRRHTRYRPTRFLNRRRRPQWLPPSLESRVCNIMTWVRRLQRWCPLGACSVELVRFDTVALENPEARGVHYQRGTLFGYEVKEYLLAKWGHRCAYCGAMGTPLEIEHIVPRSRGGSNRVSNLTLACAPCNQRKGAMTAAEFGYPRVQAQARQPLRDAAAVNSTRWALYRQLVVTGLQIEAGTGGRTRYNRTQRGLPKRHWLDAANVGASTPALLRLRGVRLLMIRATGHGTRQMSRPDRYGFPLGHKPRAKSFRGFRTGDLVRAVVPRGRAAGTLVGRTKIRFRPQFVLNGQNVHPMYLTRLQQADGYEYGFGAALGQEGGTS